MRFFHWSFLALFLSLGVSPPGEVRVQPPPAEHDLQKPSQSMSPPGEVRVHRAVSPPGEVRVHLWAKPIRVKGGLVCGYLFGS